MDNKSLSQLTKDYSAGEIGEREYREMRSKLIQEIVSGNVVLEKSEYTKPSVPVKKSRKKTRTKINLQNNSALMNFTTYLFPEYLTFFYGKNKLEKT